MKLLRPFKRIAKHIKRRFLRYLGVGFFCAVLLGGGVVYYGTTGTEQIECNRLQLPQEALPGTGPLRIAFICDIHNSKEGMKQIVAHVQEAKPDLILLGGDYVTAGQRFMRTRWAINGLKELAEIAPVFAILGNHDYEKLDQVERVLQAAEIPILRNEARNWETPSGGTLCIAGLGDWNEGDEDPHSCLLPNGEEESSVLLVAHDPESRWLVRQYDWDMMLSGHTHGGQIGNPFKNPVEYISMRSSMPAGLFDFEGGRRVFVSRGAGSICGMRFFCPPEINIIDIGDRANFVPPAEDDTAESEQAENEAEATDEAETTDTPEPETPPCPEPPPAADDATLEQTPPTPAEDSIIPELPLPA